jgi:hypothetical protein
LLDQNLQKFEALSGAVRASLDEMENAIREGNLAKALYCRAPAENYLKLINFDIIFIH